MPSLRRNLPLIALEAVAVDLETTGLDLEKARIIEIGAARLDGGRIDQEGAFERFVRPGLPLPTETMRITGITEAMLAEAPGFADAYREFRRFLGDAIVIGHSVGFDLAMFKREAERTGETWRAPDVLDTRLLGSIAVPRLPDHSLETLASFLGLELGTRHRALADAVLSARVFVALVPRLRELGIHTFGEAEQACRKLSDQLDAYHRAGWVEPIAAAGAARLEDARFDSYPYRHRVRDLMSSPPLRIGAGASLRDGMRLMAEKRISAIFVGEAGNGADWGILTERDVLRRIAREDAAALDRPVAEFASRPLATVPSEAFAYRAIGRMARLNIRHLAVRDESGTIVGVVSSRDLLKLRASPAIELGDDVDSARDEAALARAWAKLPAMANGLFREGIDARDIAGIIAREIGALTRRAAELAEAAMIAEGKGGPPRPFAVLVLGSAGRGESLLSMDQDNALVYAGEEDEAADAWFAELGTRFTETLHRVGVPLCKGGVMASNPAFRASLAEWQRRIQDWVRRANPQDLLNVDIFFDLRPVHGDLALGAELANAAIEAARGQASFLKLLVETHEQGDSPFALLGGFRLEDGRIDLKHHALARIVAAARVMALAVADRSRSTADRLAAVRAAGLGGDSDLEAMDEAHRHALAFVLDQQLADIASGLPPSPRIRVDRLDAAAKARLKQDLNRLAHVTTATRDWLTDALGRG